MFSWSHFLTYAVITAVTPGPNTITSMTNGRRYGFRKAFPYNLGILCGFSIVMLLCTLFCSTLSAFLPKVKLPMLLLGAAYMLYLAWKTWKSTDDIVELPAKGGFLAGFTLQFINPKIYIYGVVSLEAYILPYYGDQPVKLMGFALLLAGIGFVLTLLWSAFGSAFRLLFSRYARITNAVMALLLAYCAVSLFL